MCIESGTTEQEVEGAVGVKSLVNISIGRLHAGVMHDVYVHRHGWRYGCL
jgi:hypothetical protein